MGIQIFGRDTFEDNLWRRAIEVFCSRVWAGHEDRLKFYWDTMGLHLRVDVDDCGKVVTDDRFTPWIHPEMSEVQVPTFEDDCVHRCSSRAEDVLCALQILAKNVAVRMLVITFEDGQEFIFWKTSQRGFLGMAARGNFK